MKDDKLLMTIAVAAVAVSLVAAGFTYFSISSLVTRISGYATEIGTANLTVESLVSINFSTRLIDWGSGKVDPGSSSAALTTLETGNVTGGNWTLQTVGGLRIENTGNNNVTLNITVGKNASNFIGGSGPGYELNITNVEAGSCVNDTGLTLGEWFNANTSASFNCGVFAFETSKDEIRIDINLTIPEDSITGALGDVITATATAV